MGRFDYTMLALSSLLFFGLSAFKFSAVAAFPDRIDESYTFQQFLDDFHKSYDSQEEYNLRQDIFQENLQTILEHNAQVDIKKGGYVLGIGPMMELRADELPKGYDKAKPSLTTSTARKLAQTTSSLPFKVEPVSDLPESVDWRTHRVTTPVKTQGGCGSCWAFASTAVLESHIALQTGMLYSLSEQELVSCAENPRHCGGSGGCTGSTAEIAFEYVKQHGIVEEWEFGYQSFHGTKVNCTLKDAPGSSPSLLRGTIQKPYLKEAVATITDWVTLPSNNYTTLMNAIAKLGPVAVSVAASPWHLYKGGVFHSRLETKFETDVNHLVVLEGYGTDQETGEMFWLIRNSWSPAWGEAGYIRLKRVDPSTLEDPESDCGMDITPADGLACTKDDSGNDIVPPAAKICGTSGVLFDTSIPLGGHLV